MTEMEMLEACIVAAQEQYAALEQALAPLDETLELLQKNWRPRHRLFWKRLLETDIAALRTETNACFSLLSQRDIPPIVAIHRTSYTFPLYRIERQIEECGILLTAYVCTFDKLDMEMRIRARRPIVHALEALSKIVHEVTQTASEQLKTLPVELRLLLNPPMRRLLFVEDKI